MASADRNVGTNTGNLNVPDEARRDYATTIAQPEVTLVTTNGGVLDIRAEMMAGSEFSNLWAMATAILLERNLEDTAR